MVPPQPVALSGPGGGGSDGPGPWIFSIGRNRGFYPADLLFLLYLSVGLALLLVGAHRIESGPCLIAVHVAAIAGVILLGRAPRPRIRILRLLREAYPLFLMPAAYVELRYLNRIPTASYHDALVLHWDQIVFRGHPHLFLQSLLPFASLSEVLHFCYLIYEIMVPILGLTLFLQRRYEVFRVFTTAVTLTFYGCYLIYIFFPVQGPFYSPVHPDGFSGGLFSHIVRDHLLKAASRGTAFPSSHVAGAIVVSVMARRFSRRLSYFLFLLTLGIAMATVYGGFHYGIDVLAGIVFGLAAALSAPKVHTFLLRSSRVLYIPLNGVSRRASGAQEASLQASSRSKKIERSRG